jgi:hypothetical protein
MNKKILVIYSSDMKSERESINKFVEVLRNKPDKPKVDLRERRKTGLYPSQVAEYSELYVFFRELNLVIDFIKMVPKVYLYFKDINKTAEYRSTILKICNKNAGGKDLHFRSIETI